MNADTLSTIQHSVIFFTCIAAWLVLTLSHQSDPAASDMLIALAGSAAGSAFQRGKNPTDKGTTP